MPEILHQPAHKLINVNPSILSFYPRAIVPLITRQATKEFAQYKRAKGKNGGEEFEDDGNYGSAAIADVAVLQVISKRIHYGKLVLTTLPRFCSVLNVKAVSLDGFSKTSVP
jgi:chorismate mutase